LEEFVAIAAGLADDRPRRRALRMTLRQVLREHPLGDAQRFVNAFYARTAEACRA
jgi:hypothetical protein